MACLPSGDRYAIMGAFLLPNFWGAVLLGPAGVHFGAWGGFQYDWIKKTFRYSSRIATGFKG
jgi:hypothetical protein